MVEEWRSIEGFPGYEVSNISQTTVSRIKHGREGRYVTT